MEQYVDAFTGVVDCTLRDGGYYTNWDFTEEVLDAYVRAMAANELVSGVEIGYRAPAKAGYSGRFFHLPKALMERVRAQLRPDQKLIVMLNEKEATPALIPELLSDLVGIVDMIRFATPPTAAASAIALTDACVALGFEVGLNIMYMNKYVYDAAVLAPLAEAKASVIALVDSYGACTPDQVRETVKQAVQILPQPIGFHGHDNIGLAFANGLAAIDGGATSLDTTVVGMGRGAGNLKTELVISYFALARGRAADFASLSKAVELFEGLQAEYKWGSNLAYMISGFAGLPQADVMDWFGTKRYGLGSIVEALRQQGGAEIDARSFSSISDSPIAADCKNLPAVIIGGGGSVRDHFEAIRTFVQKSDAVVIHSTTRHAALFKGLQCRQVFCLAGEEIGRLSSEERRSILQGDNRVVAVQQPPRLMNVASGLEVIHEVQGLAEHAAHLGPVSDEPPLDLAIMAAHQLDVSRMYLAGFDGYENAGLADQQNARDVQVALHAALDRFGAEQVQSLTSTFYDVPETSVYALIQGK